MISASKREAVRCPIPLVLTLDRAVREPLRRRLRHHPQRPINSSPSLIVVRRVLPPRLLFSAFYTKQTFIHGLISFHPIPCVLSLLRSFISFHLHRVPTQVAVSFVVSPLSFILAAVKHVTCKQLVFTLSVASHHIKHNIIHNTSSHRSSVLLPPSLLCCTRLPVLSFAHFCSGIYPRFLLVHANVLHKIILLGRRARCALLCCVCYQQVTSFYSLVAFNQSLAYLRQSVKYRILLDLCKSDHKGQRNNN